MFREAEGDATNLDREVEGAKVAALALLTLLSRGNFEARNIARIK